ncbi:MAG TPA: methyltransferase domain-containing protein [Gemmatimonadales bacterium]|nr:methyltransferase domain-containing protein [Gemmatimonadales bacterium]
MADALKPLARARTRLPRSLVHALRRVRTAGYWLLQPLDTLLRPFVPATRRAPRPPLWLRRHAGPIRDFDRAAAELSAVIGARALLQESDAVLDIGCGCGSMALEFRNVLGAHGSYVGFDVHRPSIAWCKRHFASDPRFRFELASLETAWSRGGEAVSQYRFPAADDSMTFVLAKSVFTHLLEEDARHYLRELRRVLQEGRRALVTAFLLGEEGDPRFPYGGPDLWWRMSNRPEAGVAFKRSRFVAEARAANLRVVELIRGYWSGDQTGPTLQDIAILG